MLSYNLCEYRLKISYFSNTFLIMVMKDCIIVVILATGYAVRCVCPEPHLISPCVCKEEQSPEWINCGGNSSIDLIHIFETLKTNLTKSQKHFYGFLLNNTAITELKDNTFRDITFDSIRIESCTNLTKIQWNTFINTDKITRHLYIGYNPRLSEISIFEILTKFKNVEHIHLVYNNISEIPSNAFHSTNSGQDHLIDLHISGSSITKIGNNAFSTLNNLAHLHIFSTLIDYFTEYAFAFDKESKNNLDFFLSRNTSLTSSNFHPNSLIHLKRPTDLNISWVTNMIEYLDEKVFRKFLDINSENTIDIYGQPFDCYDCKNYWLKKYPDYLKRIEFLKCSNSKIFFDQDNFKNCFWIIVE